jgi:hypothetical protein
MLIYFNLKAFLFVNELYFTPYKLIVDIKQSIYGFQVNGNNNSDFILVFY